MDYMDAEILEQKKEQEQIRNSDISKGEVYIGGGYLPFADVLLFENRMSIRLPETFLDMPSAVAAVKYPMEQRPQIIKTSEDSTVNFSFNLFDQAFRSDQVKEAASVFQTVVKKMSPSSRLFENQVEPLQATQLGWFDFKASSIDEPVYTLMGVTVVDNKLLHVIFSCPHESMKAWKPIALQVFRSIKNISAPDERGISS